MPTTSTSGLSTNVDFASDLLLNRIMNGQLDADSNRTISAATRTAAARLDSEASKLGVTAANVAQGLKFAQGAENALTELLDQVRDVSQQASTLAASGDTTAMAAFKDNYGTKMNAILNSLLKTDIGNVEVLGAGSTNINLGTGANETLTLGSFNVNSGAFSSMLAGLTANTATDAAGLSNIASWADQAVGDLLSKISVAGAQVSTMENRYDMLNDLINTYRDASNDQAYTRGGSASQLLSQIL